MSKEKKSYKFYMIFVKRDMLDVRSTIIDRLWENGCGPDNGCPPLLLFAITTKKKMLKDFFMIHKREMFHVIKMDGESAGECYGKMSTNDHWYMENELRNVEKRYEGDDCAQFEAVLSPYWLKHYDVTMGYEYNDRLRIMNADVCLSEDEYDIVQSYRGMDMDEDVDEIYRNIDFMNFLVKNILSKRLVKCLERLHYKELQQFATAIYGPLGSPISKIEYNEYGSLMRLYGEVLIGGNDDGTNYIV